jgi:hypothetical protein
MDAAGDVDLSAGLVRQGWNLKTARDKLGAAFVGAVKKTGGPMQFLSQRYPTQTDRETYARDLWNQFPPMDTNPPNLAWPISSGSHVLHLAQLDFSKLCTMKGPPALRTSILLADDILTSGFVTENDPISVIPLSDITCSVNGPWGGASMAFSMGYIKGAARLCTLHTLVTLCLDDSVDLHKACLPWCALVCQPGGPLVHRSSLVHQPMGSACAPPAPWCAIPGGRLHA